MVVPMSGSSSPAGVARSTGEPLASVAPEAALTGVDGGHGSFSACSLLQIAHRTGNWV